MCHSLPISASYFVACHLSPWHCSNNYPQLIRLQKAHHTLYSFVLNAVTVYCPLLTWHFLRHRNILPLNNAGPWNEIHRQHRQKQKTLARPECQTPEKLADVESFIAGKHPTATFRSRLFVVPDHAQRGNKLILLCNYHFGLMILFERLSRR